MSGIRGLKLWLQEQKFLQTITYGDIAGGILGIDLHTFVQQSGIHFGTEGKFFGMYDFDTACKYVKSELQLFKKYNITPLFVVSGLLQNDHIEQASTSSGVIVPNVTLAFRDTTAEVRDSSFKNINGVSCHELVDKLSEASITAPQYQSVVDALVLNGAKVITAPYTSVHQLVYLADQGYTNFTYGPLTQIPLGVQNVILNMSREAIVAVHSLSIFSKFQLTRLQFVYACILAGLDGPTYPGYKKFKFSDTITSVSGTASFEKIVHDCKFPNKLEKAKYIASITKSLEKLLCVPAMHNRDLKTFDLAASIPFPKLKTSAAAYTLSGRLSTLVALHSVSAHSLNPLMSGIVVDTCPVAPSKEYQHVLDWMNTVLRGPSYTVLLAVLGAQNEAVYKAYNSVFTETSDNPTSFVNARWCDVALNNWPQFFKASYNREEAQSLVQACITKAAVLPVHSGDVSLTSILTALTTSPNTTDSMDGTLQVMVAAYLLLSVQLGFLNTDLVLTNMGQVVVDKSLGDSLALLLVLEKSNTVPFTKGCTAVTCVDASKTMSLVTRSDTHDSKTARVLATKIDNEAAFAGRLKHTILDHDVCMISSIINAFIHTVKTSLDVNVASVVLSLPSVDNVALGQVRGLAGIYQLVSNAVPALVYKATGQADTEYLAASQEIFEQ